LTKEYEEIKRQIEEDADTEIVDIKAKYEKKLREQLELNEKIQSEAANIRKKVGTVYDTLFHSQKLRPNQDSLLKINRMESDAEAYKKKIEQLTLDVAKGNNMISSLKKDIEGFKKEIAERDDTIQDKEKRIYDLKKKNQELEKFKFVLDYKIKEQKKMVEPREMEIKDLKEEKTKMESELERFNKQNTQLGLDVKEMQSRLAATQRELKKEQGDVSRF
jgi:chromosome segregation ATPase